jgi:hypothetical protein
MGTSGSVIVLLRVSKTFGLGCSGPGGSASKTVLVTFLEPAHAAVSATALVSLRALARWRAVRARAET